MLTHGGSNLMRGAPHLRTDYGLNPYLEFGAGKSVASFALRYNHRWAP